MDSGKKSTTTDNPGIDIFLVGSSLSLVLRWVALYDCVDAARAWPQGEE